MGFEVSKTIQQRLFGFEESKKATDFNETKREVDESVILNNENEKGSSYNNNNNNNNNNQKNDKTVTIPDWEHILKLIRNGEYEEALRELQRPERSISSSSLSNETTASSKLTSRDVLIQFVRQRFFTAIRDDIPALAAPYAVLYVTLGADPHEAAQYINVQSHSLWTKRFEPLILQLLSQLELTIVSNPPPLSSSSSLSILTQDPAHLRTTRLRSTPTFSSLTLTPAALLHQLYTTVIHYQITHTYIGDILGTKESLWLMAHAQSFVEHIALFALHALRASTQLDDLVHETGKTLLTVDSITLTDLLDELALVSHHTEHYRLHLRNFYENGITRLREKGFSFISENIQNKSENTLCITDYVQDPAGLFTLLELLISRHYIPLEETFFIQNINKILKDEAGHVHSLHCSEEENKKPSGLFQNRESIVSAPLLISATKTSPSTSYLDDIFIVSEKCAERVLSTLNVDAGSHVLEFLFSNLRGTFKDILLQRLKEALDSERIIRMGTSQQYTHLHISRLLNTFSASTTFITTLYESVLKRLQRLFKSNPDDDKERIYRLVTRHGSLTVEDFQKAFHNAVDMFVQFLWTQLQVSIGRFGQLNYNFDQNQYKIYEINDPWVEAFTHSMQEMVVSPYRTFLVDGAWEEVIVCLLDVLLVDLERIIMKKTYTYYGGLQLHNDIQQLFKYFSSLIKRTVRDRFTRLLQITSLLTLEKVSEVSDYWYTENMKWRLNPDEAREVLRRRKDFNSVAIDRLKLESTVEN